MREEFDFKERQKSNADMKVICRYTLGITCIQNPVLYIYICVFYLDLHKYMKVICSYILGIRFIQNPTLYIYILVFYLYLNKYFRITILRIYWMHVKKCLVVFNLGFKF